MLPSVCHFTSWRNLNATIMGQNFFWIRIHIFFRPKYFTNYVSSNFGQVCTIFKVNFKIVLTSLWNISKRKNRLKNSIFGTIKVKTIHYGITELRTGLSKVNVHKSFGEFSILVNYKTCTHEFLSQKSLNIIKQNIKYFCLFC